MPVILLVSKDETSKVARALQPQNMLFMFLTFAVSNDETFKAVRAEL